jgi:hypothetical protein
MTSSVEKKLPYWARPESMDEATPPGADDEDAGAGKALASDALGAVSRAFSRPQEQMNVPPMQNFGVMEKQNPFRPDTPQMPFAELGNAALL